MLPTRRLLLYSCSCVRKLLCSVDALFFWCYFASVSMPLKQVSHVRSKLLVIQRRLKLRNTQTVSDNFRLVRDAVSDCVLVWVRQFQNMSESVRPCQPCIVWGFRLVQQVSKYVRICHTCFWNCRINIWDCMMWSSSFLKPLLSCLKNLSPKP